MLFLDYTRWFIFRPTRVIFRSTQQLYSYNKIYSIRSCIYRAQPRIVYMELLNVV